MLKRLLPVSLLAAGALLLAGCGGSSSSSGTPTLTVAFVVDPQWAQVAVAQARGYFSRHHVAVKIEDYSTGPEALDALKAGAVDVATAADVPTASALAVDPSLRVIADGSRWNASRIIARRASGINNVADLAGKKIGTPVGTSANYFGDLVLSEARVKATFVQTAPPTAVSAITNGDVDALSIFEPYQVQAEQALGKQATILAAPGRSYIEHCLYLTSSSVEHSKAAALRSFLAAIAEADPLVQHHAPAALTAVSKATGLSVALLTRIAPQYSYGTELDPAALSAKLAGLHKWASQNHFVPASETPPNYASMVVANLLPAKLSARNTAN